MSEALTFKSGLEMSPGFDPRCSGGTMTHGRDKTAAAAMLGRARINTPMCS